MPLVFKTRVSSNKTAAFRLNAKVRILGENLKANSTPISASGQLLVAQLILVLKCLLELGNDFPSVFGESTSRCFFRILNIKA